MVVSLQERFSLYRFFGITNIHPPLEGWSIGVSDQSKDGHDVAQRGRFNLIYTAILCYCLCPPPFQLTHNGRIVPPLLSALCVTDSMEQDSTDFLRHIDNVPHPILSS
jgi:hypothetical protein